MQQRHYMILLRQDKKITRSVTQLQTEAQANAPLITWKQLKQGCPHRRRDMSSQASDSLLVCHCYGPSSTGYYCIHLHPTSRSRAGGLICLAASLKWKSRPEGVEDQVVGYHTLKPVISPDPQPVPSYRLACTDPFLPCPGPAVKRCAQVGSEGSKSTY